MKSDRFLTLYLAAAASIGMLFAFIVTFRFGPGLATDGARYLSTAESLLHGQGFTEYLGVPLTQFPPLYSIIVAAISLATQADVFIVAQYLNIVTFGLTIWLAGSFFRQLFPQTPMVTIIGSGVFATSISLLRMASNVLSDLLFLALSIVILIRCMIYLQEPTRRNLLWLGILCTVSPLLRYAGLTHILTATLIIFVANWRDRIKALTASGLFGLLTSFPTLAWVYFHNYLRTGILFGTRLPPNPLGNLQTTVEKTVHWFIPYSVTDRIPEWLILSAIVLILIAGNRSEDWKKFAGKASSAGFLPNLLFLVLYSGVLIFNVSYSEVRWPFMDRIHIIILPSVMALGFLAVMELTPQFLRRIPQATMQTWILLGFILWLAYPANNLQKYLRSGFYDGETSEYNIYNTRAQNESGVEVFIRSLSITSEEKVYSNYEPLAWFYTRHTILKLPQGPALPEKPDPNEVWQNYPDWPGDNGTGYVIWLKELGFKEYVLTPEQLASKADLKLLYSSKQGDVYRITPK